MATPARDDRLADSQAFQLPERSGPMQFGLKMVFAATTIVGVICGAIYWIGLLSTIGLLLMVGGTVAGYALASSPSGKVRSTLAGFFLGAVLAAVLLPAMQPPACVSTRRDACNYNMKQIALGLQVYADIYHCFPPAYIADDQGRPMHSWRVLILPYIEQRVLYDKYDFSEPWDGPHNSLLAVQMPACYRCPSDGGPSTAGATNYLAVSGPQTIWPASGCTPFGQVKDGSSNTLAVLEVAGWNVPWMEPRDLPYTALARGINPRAGFGASSRHARGAWAAFCDGHTAFLPDDAPVTDLQALATKDGGERLSHDY